MPGEPTNRARTPSGTAAACSIVLLCLCPAADAGLRLSAATGGAMESGVAVRRVSLAREWDHSVWNRPRIWQRLLWEITFTHWDSAGTDPRQDTVALGARASYRFSLGPAHRTYLEFGTGPLWVDHPVLMTDLDVGAHVGFDTHVAIGRVIGPQRAFEFTAGAHRVSNAGIGRGNPDVDFILLSLGVDF